MRINATTPDQYFDQLPAERKPAMERLRKTIIENLPDGFAETISYGMIAYMVPHSIYPKGYHCNPKEPLPFMSIASQKNCIVLYHMGMYMDKELMTWFSGEYARRSKTKPDMGKSCIRFKKPEQIPYDLVGELAGKISVDEWIRIFEAGIHR